MILNCRLQQNIFLLISVNERLQVEGRSQGLFITKRRYVNDGFVQFSDILWNRLYVSFYTIILEFCKEFLLFTWL